MGKVIALSSDHGGYQLKEAIKKAIIAMGHEVIDYGVGGDGESVDYPDYVQKMGASVRNGQASLGITVCTTGLGACISANKLKGIRAAYAVNEDAAAFSRLHNDANVLCFGQKYHDIDFAKKAVKVFLEKEFEGGRHQRRVEKLEQ